LAKISDELLNELDKNTVDFIDNFDASLKEPTVLPAKLPNLLLMGADGIAVGMATKIPPHNLGEVIDAIQILIKKTKAAPSPDKPKKIVDPENINPALLAGNLESVVTSAELMTAIPGPDFPTGGIIYNAAAIEQVYTTGRGTITVRAKTEIVERKGRSLGAAFSFAIMQTPGTAQVQAGFVAEALGSSREERSEAPRAVESL